MSENDDDGKNSDEPTGRAKGGVARALILSPERRSEIARTAARARHGVPLKATHRGNFKEHFGGDVECYVLDDDQKTAVISQRGMGAALGLGQSTGARLPRFVSGEKIAPYVGAELGEKLGNPIVFQWIPPVPNMGPPATVHGYDATILIDLCKVILKAEDDGKLLERQKQIAKQSHIILNASAKLGIKQLVYALSGYDLKQEEVIAAFKFYVREVAREYEKEFPDELYAEWYRLYQLPKPEKNKPWKFRTLTIEHVYWPLARSSGTVLELTRAMRATSGDRYKKLHQFLSDVGVKALRRHLGRLLGMAETSKTRADYERHVNEKFGLQTSFAVDGF